MVQNQFAPGTAPAATDMVISAFYAYVVIIADGNDGGRNAAPWGGGGGGGGGLAVSCGVWWRRSEVVTAAVRLEDDSYTESTFSRCSVSAMGATVRAAVCLRDRHCVLRELAGGEWKERRWRRCAQPVRLASQHASVADEATC